LTIERTALKRASSRANGTKFGRPRKVDDAEHIATAKRMKADGHTAKDIAKFLGVSRATLYRYLAPDLAACSDRAGLTTRPCATGRRSSDIGMA
jgi:DNA invertase Pin-like site-specific DNA recombinase